MSNCLWTFETPTTTGLEADVDTISGVSMASLGDGSGLGAVPVPTVPGHTGNGRLLCSAGHYNAFATERLAAILHTSGNPLTIDFWWRPLIDYAGALAGYQMLEASYQSYVAPAGGVADIRTRIYSEATVGLYTFRFFLSGFYAGPTTVVVATGVPLNLRGWNQIVVDYDGANTITLTVNGNLVGTVGPTDFVMATSELGQLLFDLFSSELAAIYGVLDTVSLNVS